MSLIELKNISKTYYIGNKVAVRALNDVSLKIEQGEFVAIMGPSGSGKSTLLAVLGLLDELDSGEYILQDKNIAHLKEDDYAGLRNRFFGFIFQMFNLLPKLNIVDNTMLPFIYSGEITEEKKQKAMGILKRVGLGDRLHHKPNELSGGQQQRVAVARALANDPLVILADEPTGNLDSKSSAEIMGILKELHGQGNTIVMVTHESGIAAAASRVLTLKDGKIVRDEVRRRHDKLPDSKTIEIKHKAKHVFSFSQLINYSYEAGLALLNNKLRSFLSILGVLIGVGAVITMLAIGTGAKQKVEQTMSSLGTNILMVRTSHRSRGIAMGGESSTRFNFSDYDSIKRMDGVKSVVPYVSGSAQVVNKNKNWRTSIVGTTYEYKDVKNSDASEGRFFSMSEGLGRKKIAVLGAAVVKELFADENPVGQSIRINRVNFEVIGVLPEKGISGWRNVDDQIVIPIKTAMYRLLGKDYIDYFDVQARDEESIPLVQEEIVKMIVKNHRLSEAASESIMVRNMAEIQAAASAMTDTLSVLLGGIAAISLLVGGIGIMNIMLVVIMERTHEIGLRKALGAQRGDILLQFLVESVMICFVGGMIGVVLGSVVSWLISTFVGWNAVISLWSVILAFTFSVVIGVVFGIWPAYRASKLLPIVALRYE
ncbi:MAG: ABC transporter permease [Candidatus Saganbacteria bacterium]|nr:ABC transporter permease [Candidatus Saganbacteria bacterium]